MKKTITIIIAGLIFAVTIFFTTYHFYGLFTEFNYFTAKKDLSNGIVMIIQYGEAAPNEENLSALAARYGFSYYQAGCAVSQAEINGIKQYNKVVVNYLEEINGKSWMMEFKKREDI